MSCLGVCSSLQLCKLKEEILLDVADCAKVEDGAGHKNVRNPATRHLFRSAASGLTVSKRSVPKLNKRTPGSAAWRASGGDSVRIHGGDSTAGGSGSGSKQLSSGVSGGGGSVGSGMSVEGGGVSFTAPGGRDHPV